MQLYNRLSVIHPTRATLLLAVVRKLSGCARQSPILEASQKEVAIGVVDDAAAPYHFASIGRNGGVEVTNRATGERSTQTVEEVEALIRGV